MKLSNEIVGKYHALSKRAKTMLDVKFKLEHKSMRKSLSDVFSDSEVSPEVYFWLKAKLIKPTQEEESLFI